VITVFPHQELTGTL